MLLSDLVRRFVEFERGAANILPLEQVSAQAVAAVSFYAGYSTLDDESDISGQMDITISEWAEIRPLFVLYVERENALQMEATRSLGADPFGRSSSEAAQDIAQMEADLPRRVFYQPVVTI